MEVPFYIEHFWTSAFVISWNTNECRHGILNMLYDIYKNFDPEYMAVSFDKNKQTFRSEVYKEYKATRKPAPPELVPQFALIREALRTLGAAVYEVDGYEGDDILGTLAARYEKELPVFIVTGDRDALQLATKDTTVYITQRGVSQNGGDDAGSSCGEIWNHASAGY